MLERGILDLDTKVFPQRARELSVQPAPFSTKALPCTYIRGPVVMIGTLIRKLVLLGCENRSALFASAAKVPPLLSVLRKEPPFRSEAWL